MNIFILFFYLQLITKVLNIFYLAGNLHVLWVNVGSYGERLVVHALQSTPISNSITWPSLQCTVTGAIPEFVETYFYTLGHLPPYHTLAASTCTRSFCCHWCARVSLLESCVSASTDSYWGNWASSNQHCTGIDHLTISLSNIFSYIWCHTQATSF